MDWPARLTISEYEHALRLIKGFKLPNAWDDAYPRSKASTVRLVKVLEELVSLTRPVGI